MRCRFIRSAYTRPPVTWHLGFTGRLHGKGSNHSLGCFVVTDRPKLWFDPFAEEAIAFRPPLGHGAHEPVGFVLSPDHFAHPANCL